MAYSAEISRTNPTCLVILIDQSGSMAEPFGPGGVGSKAEKVAEAINRTLKNLVIKCTKAVGVRDYFHISLIGYGAGVGSAFGGPLAGRALAPVGTVATGLMRLDERTETVTGRDGQAVERSVRQPVWVEPKAKGKTPMCAALGVARDVTARFLGEFPDCFPPIVLNLSDGLATDGDPGPAAAALQALASSDGPVLLFNAHLSALGRTPVTFPVDDAGLPDEHARRLFAMSSALPPDFLATVAAEGYPVVRGARGFVYNADFTAVDKFLTIGTRRLEHAAGRAR